MDARIAALRQQLVDGQQALRAAFEHDGNPQRLLRGRCRLVDKTLQTLWQESALPGSYALLAVGGYGRGELYPYSDVDILLLMDAEPDGPTCGLIERFISRMWDLGLNVGHSVRTLEVCLDEASQDVTIQTNLLEARLLAGSRRLHREFIAHRADHLDIETFYSAKLAEQAQRYNRFNHTPFSLEPNCKESPGGLRDLQTIIWIALGAGLGARWQDLATHGLITPEELRALRSNERLLQQVRIRLHHIAGRHEDRLVFDHQESLAASFGITASSGKRASEVVMQRYYLAAKRITQLNSIILQSLGERFTPLATWETFAINERFQARGDQLDIVADDVFQHAPSAILESFLLMQQHPELKGMTVRTLRALWHARRLITPAFRRDPRNRELFLRMLQEPRGQTHEFRRLNQYSILGAYLPNFARIVGQMQHDLFHVYTVDQHILQVLRNVRRFVVEEHAHEYPLLTRLINDFDRYWLIFIAALFHDIAKGRGGDHSKLGMADARRFCRAHGLAREDTALVVWLVEHHLTMSQIAQKQDLSDPEVIRRFGALVKTERRLTALYILTHADIRGTSPKVWNNWKASLLEELFLATRQLLQGKRPQQLLGISERQEAARERLRFFGLRPGTEDAFWRKLDTLYFMRHDPEEVAWHTRTLYYRPDSPEPVVKARMSPIGRGLQVMVYTRDQRDLFTSQCGFFARMGYTILDAKIHTTGDGYALDSFVIMDPNESEVAAHYRDVVTLIEHELAARLACGDCIDPPPPGRLSRQLKHFPIAPSVILQPDERSQHFILSIAAADRPGLLYNVARTLAAHEINLHTAKIATLGERAEDTFLVSGAALDNSAKTVQLQAELLEKLRL
ncbi:MAG: [protein-PII] uridylyltransferase [Candidatus Dactylopiibacterium carminicum]|uniref:Bifunctional uridylyltransferase/uridylyl-removing enzyme n=1 Tax=Candidatus Dactylopiibacterium carminicum TaxID=857335 RepID=A0A272EP73_9RHOO|nr:[protein-PII] uridylyltransferase [Candidatus Dactylopiibacterium carminicum]KAF7598237.1 [protein-PII] uridylyltransferase [Candidatus Dactylopiibacterium carminicum]PAS91891.1 MAG: [protein-PII] uridylyltransferase [Candidatus Dactylopiibacterium carminicum]PAS94867.1 MAG: [protein-PII] uridylyltransferase [Candidatus Dactylopiibacterium carminicum]PAS97080.1 MAG: [protein-PII] uridylyltransferase [Candidatus Dactylopiibacterium carminicum]